MAKAQKLLGRNQPLPGRTFVRKQGCWNCISWENGTLYEQRKRETAQRDAKVLLEQGHTLEKVGVFASLRERLLTEKQAGLCLKGCGADFVVATYLCDKWTGRVGVDQTQGGIDDLPAELKDKLGDQT